MLCNLYSDFLESTDEKPILPNDPSVGKKALYVFAFMCLLVILVIFFRDKIGAVADFLVSIPEKIGNFFKKAFTTFTDFFKNMVNTVINLIRKIPTMGDFGTLMETSTMKKEREEKERAESRDE